MSNHTTATNYSFLAREARLKILDMVYRAQTSHIASNYSVIDLATVLYENIKADDRVVWSKGWAAASIYYFLAKEGKIPKEDLDKFAKEENGSIKYLGLAETTTPGVLCNGGSVGHGLPIAVGIAYAKKLSGDPGMVYCIMSDGELNEGSTWEAVMFATHHKLNNLMAIIDNNRWQAMGRTKEVINLSPQKTFNGFGWSVKSVDGHNFSEIEACLKRGSRKPLVVVANTVKGKGVSFFEDHLLFHYKHITTEEYERAKKELNN